MNVCVVIPCYRDADRLARYLPLLAEALPADAGATLLVVDDGSGPGHAEHTAEVVEAARARFPHVLPLLALPANRGKGGAVYAGWEAAPADAEWLAFVDADGAVSAPEVARVLELVRADSTGTAAWLASRVKMLGHTVDRSVKRHLSGRIFATLTSIATGLGVYDSQCGLKVVRRDAFARIRPHLRETRFAFDVELLVHLDRAGYRLREVPVDWSDVPGSKVALGRDSLQMAGALLRIRRGLAPISRP